MSWMMKAHERNEMLNMARYMIADIDHIKSCKEKIRSKKDEMKTLTDEEDIKYCQLSIDVAEDDIREWKMEYTTHFNTLKHILLKWSEKA